MDNLTQDCVIRIKCTVNAHIYEFVIPNNSPTVDAIEALTFFQKALLDSLKHIKEQQEPTEAPAKECVADVESDR